MEVFNELMESEVSIIVPHVTEIVRFCLEVGAECLNSVLTFQFCVLNFILISELMNNVCDLSAWRVICENSDNFCSISMFVSGGQWHHTEWLSASESTLLYCLPHQTEEQGKVTHQSKFYARIVVADIDTIIPFTVVGITDEIIVVYFIGNKNIQLSFITFHISVQTKCFDCMQTKDGSFVLVFSG